MYKQSHWALGLGAFGSLGFHLTGTGIIWSVVLAATLTGMSLSIGRIALELGLPHPNTLLTTLRNHHKPTLTPPCPHCGTTHL